MDDLYVFTCSNMNSIQTLPDSCPWHTHLPVHCTWAHTVPNPNPCLNPSLPLIWHTNQTNTVASVSFVKGSVFVWIFRLCLAELGTGNNCRDNETVSSGQQIVVCCLVAIYVLATLFWDQGIKCFRFFACHRSSVKLSQRCWILSYAQLWFFLDISFAFTLSVCGGIFWPTWQLVSGTQVPHKLPSSPSQAAKYPHSLLWRI